MKRLNHYAYLLSFIALFSCKNVMNDPIVHFDNKPIERINHSKIINLEDFGILKPLDVILTDNNYVIWDGRQENMFNILSHTFDPKIIKGVRKGNGPNDIISPSSFQQQNNETLIYDIAQKKMNRIELLSDTTLILQEIQKISLDKRLFIINCIDSNFVASGIFEEFWLANIGKDGEILTKIDFPLYDEIKSIPKMQLSILYISTLIANSPDNLKVVAATQKHGHISFFDYANSDSLIEYKQLKYYAPKISITEKRGIAFSKDNKIGFCAVDCDNDYVYALYSGKTFDSDGLLNHHCSNLLIYDWKGNPIKRYILDIPLYSMRVDKIKKLVYGIAYTPEGVLVEYQL